MSNYLLIKVRGKNIYKFINKCKNNNINLIKIKYLNRNEIIIKINDYDYEKFIKISTLYKKKIIRKFGYIKFKDLLKKYNVFIISFIFGIFLLIFLSNIIFKVDVITNNNELKNKIIKDLDAFGIKKYSFCKKYDSINLIKKKILSKYKDNIEWIEITRNGIVYEINIVERKKIRSENNNKYTNIVAGKSGVIKNIIVESGTKVIENNNYVNKGDIIISGIIKKGDEIKGITRSKGKAYAEVWYNVNIEYPLIHKEIKYTNNSMKSFYLKIGKKYYDFSKFKKFNRDTKKIYSNRLVPLEIGMENQLEIKNVTEVLNVKEAKKKAILLAREKMINSLKENDYIIDQKTLKFSKKNSKIILDIFFSCIEEIGKEEDIIEE